jgi:hypothetical protein
MAGGMKLVPTELTVENLPLHHITLLLFGVVWCVTTMAQATAAVEIIIHRAAAASSAQALQVQRILHAACSGVWGLKALQE